MYRYFLKKHTMRNIFAFMKIIYEFKKYKNNK